MRRIHSIAFIRLSSLFSTTGSQSYYQNLPLGIMPAPPHTFGLSVSNSVSSPSLDDSIRRINQQVVDAEQRRQQALDTSHKIQAALIRATRSGYNNTEDKNIPPEVEQSIAEILEKNSATSNKQGRQPRDANLSSRMEDFARYKAFLYFLETGNLIEPIVGITDEEYLGGACMGLCQDLQRYGLGRATVRDVTSVKAAADLVGGILEYLLQLDFRNGPLRRKYDGTKYSLKALETILYELSVTGANLETLPETKRQKKELLPMDQLMKLKDRMDHRDQLREDLIKKCRDGQKAAKQAIFALHRGDTAKAGTLIDSCKRSILEDLLPIVLEEPPLRGGSFSNVIEEYVEAKLFYAWLHGSSESNEPNRKPHGTILGLDDFDIELQPEDYLGGLSDLTGEVGRYAVQSGTARDVEGVQLCLHTNRSILTALETLDRLPQGIYKKMDQNRRSVEKLERMLYEMSLSEATGRTVKSEMEENTSDEKDESNA